MKKRIISFLLALCLALMLSPATVLAAPEQTQQSDLVGTRVWGEQSNPLYGEYTRPGRDWYAPAKLYNTNVSFEPSEYLTNEEDVLLAIIAGLEQRQANIVVPWKIPVSWVSTDEDLLALILAAVATAMGHTGVPTQGDYLLWQHGYLQYGGEIPYYDGEYYYLDMIYVLEYYTTAAQEAAVTAKLETVMNSFGFTEATSDYTKVKTIYDYICANVTYDYTNLEDTTYTLKHTAYAALIDGTAVCQGYALLLYRMLLMAGVDNRIITGTGNGGGHAWNIIGLDGLYYNADSTWDEPRYKIGLDYEYFLRCPDLFTDHIRAESYATPEFHTYYPMADTDYDPSSAISVSATTGIDYVLNGRTLTVSCASACKVGYLAGDAYVKIAAAPNPDGSYSFTVPEGVSEVVVVISGDVNGNGQLQAADKSRLNAALLKKTTLSAKEVFAADVNDDGQLLAADKSRLNAVLLKKTTLTW